MWMIAIRNLLRYMPAKNNQSRPWFDLTFTFGEDSMRSSSKAIISFGPRCRPWFHKFIAKIKWCSFLTHIIAGNHINNIKYKEYHWQMSENWMSRIYTKVIQCLLFKNLADTCWCEDSALFVINKLIWLMNLTSWKNCGLDNTNKRPVPV